MKDIVMMICFTAIMLGYITAVVVLCVKHPPSWGWVVFALTIVAGSIKMKTGG